MAGSDSAGRARRRGGDRARRLARLYLVLSRANRAIEHAEDEAQLLESACQTVVEVGRFLMSWAGMADPATRSIRPVARAGRDDGYLEYVRVETAGARSEGPTGQAFRLGQTVVCDDIATDPRMQPWREEALRRNYRSSIGLPLSRAGVVVGVLTVYADQPGRFDAAEIELLEELARDVSLGLGMLEDLVERRRAETDLAESRLRFETSLETLIDPFVILRAVRDPGGRIVDFVYDYANEAACAANRVSRDELVGQRLLTLLPEHEAAGLLDAYARVIETGTPLVIDDLDYEDTWGGERMRRVFDVRAGKVGESLAYTWRDVTERRLEDRRRREELEASVGRRTAEIEMARERAVSLARMSTAVAGSTDRRAIAKHLMDAAAGLDGVTAGRIMLGEAGSEIEAAVASFGDEAAAAEPAAGSVLLSLPLEAGERSLGRLVLLFGPGRTFDEAELAFLRALDDAAAIAIERARLAESERAAYRMLDAVVAQMPVGVTVAGPDGELLYRNAALEGMLSGLWVGSASEPVAWTGFHPNGLAYARADWPVARSLATGEVVVGEEIAVARLDGTHRVVSQTSAPIRDEAARVAGAVVVTIDVTERKTQEQLRDAFLGVLSHELRSPITTIYGDAVVLAGRGSRLDDATRGELAADIAAESERLSRLVDDLLVLARAERGVDLTAGGAALVQHRLRAVVANLAAQWPDRQLSCRIAEHVPPVTGDEAYLEQVFRNLIGNAIKYGHRDVDAIVESGDDVVTVSVTDDGPGIPPADLERVFEPFFRSDSTRTAPGAGIGLFVARRLVEAMGGRIAAANRPEGGAAFTVTLPRFSEAGTE